MAFMRVNGYSVPVFAESANQQIEDIGFRERSFSGQMLSSRRARKRNWSFETNHLSEINALALQGVIDGIGDNFPYTRSSTGASFFSAKGNSPGSTIGNTRFGRGTVDDFPVVDESGVEEIAFDRTNGSSIANEGATTNLLPSGVSDATLTTGFTAIGTASLGISTTAGLQGTTSLEVTVAAANDGVETNSISASASTAYAASLYVRPASSVSLELTLLDDVGTIQQKNIAMTSGEWMRVELGGTSAGGATGIQLRVRNTTDTTDFFVDALIIDADSVSNTWTKTSRADNDLTYTIGTTQYGSDYTINYWVRLPDTQPGADTFMLHFETPEGTDTLDICRPGGTNGIIARAFDESGLIAALASFAQVPPLFGGVWHMITIVSRMNPEAGENVLEIYFDGVLEGSVPSTTAGRSMPRLGIDGMVMHVGHSGSGAEKMQHNGLMDQIQINPWAAPSAQISAWFNLGKAIPDAPSFYLDGDIMPDNELTVLAQGKISSSRYIASTAGSGAFRNNSRLLSGSINEV